MKNFNDLIDKMLEIFPDSIIEEDGDGQIIVTTGLTTDDNDNLIPMEEV